MMPRAFLVLILTIMMNSSFASEVVARANLWPSGLLEISSSKVLGHFVKKGKVISSKKVFVPIESLDSGINLRNEHIHKYLGFPKIKNISLKNLKIAGSKGKGVLKVNGISKKVMFKVSYEGKNLLGTLLVNRADFKLKKASFMGVSVKDQVEIVVTVPRSFIKVEKKK